MGGFFFFFFFFVLWGGGIELPWMGWGGGGMCLKMLDGRMIEKVGGGGGAGGGEGKCIVRSHGRHYGKRRICFFRVESQVEERERGI